MEVIGLLILGIWLLLIPTCIGGIAAAYVDKQGRSTAFMCISGYILMWAVFQVICVPCVILENRYWGMFPWVVKIFGIVSVMLALVGVLLFFKRKKLQKTEENVHKYSKKEAVLWIIFGLLVLVQLTASVCMTYGDGDDAFYVAVSTLAESSDTLYRISPYDGGSTGLDVRHGLAPFPIWIAFLARLSGLKVAFVAHVAVGTVLIGISYLIYYKIGQMLWKDKRENHPVFMIVAALLVLFGDYSYKSPENFMIARSRQGKAALGSIVIPMMFLVFIMLLEQIKQEKKAEWMLWMLMCATVTAACLCSTLGTFLTCMLLGVVGLCAGLVFRKIGPVAGMFGCCIPALVYAALYFVLG